MPLNVANQDLGGAVHLERPIKNQSRRHADRLKLLVTCVTLASLLIHKIFYVSGHERHGGILGKLEGYEGDVVLIVQEVCDSDGTVADPGAEKHQ